MSTIYQIALADAIRQMLIKRTDRVSCGFKNGKCIHEQLLSTDEEMFKHGCGCCGECHLENGYKRERDHFSEYDNSKIESQRLSNGGFLGQFGCVLPQNLRSFTCLYFTCEPIDDPDQRVSQYCEYEQIKCGELKYGDLFFWDENAIITKLEILGIDKERDQKVLSRKDKKVFRVTSI